MFEVGVIKKWFDDQGFGFIKPDSGQGDVFVHVSRVPPGLKLHVGDRVRFDRKLSERTEKCRRSIWSNSIRCLIKLASPGGHA